jgi:hypothetical protein
MMIPELRLLAIVGATVLALASAAVSLYWTLGGTALLDTVGGSLEQLARSRSEAALALGAATVLAKIIAAALSAALARPQRRRPLRLALFVTNGLACAVLILWGGANVVLGTLVLTGILRPGVEPDRRALWWHVAVWDLWFLVWGVLLGIAVATSVRTFETRPAKP